MINIYHDVHAPEILLEQGCAGHNFSQKVDAFYDFNTSIPTLLICSGTEFENAFQEFISERSKNVSTSKRYCSVANEFLNFCMYCLNVESVSSIQFEHIQEYLGRNKPLDKNVYRCSEFFIVRLLLYKFRSYCLIDKLPLPDNLDTVGRNRKFPKRLKREVFLKQDYHALYDMVDQALKSISPKGAKNNRDFTLVSFIAYSNIPIGKILGARGDDFYITESGHGLMKASSGAIEKSFKISPHVWNLIRNYVKKSHVSSGQEYVFQSFTKSHRPTGKPLDTGNAGAIVKSFCREQGIPIVTPKELTKAKAFISKVDAYAFLNDLYL